MVFMSQLNVALFYQSQLSICERMFDCGLFSSSSLASSSQMGRRMMALRDRVRLPDLL